MADWVPLTLYKGDLTETADTVREYIELLYDGWKLNAPAPPPDPFSVAQRAYLDSAYAIGIGAVGTSGPAAISADMLGTTRTWVLSSNFTLPALPSPAATKSGPVTIVFKQAASGGPYTLTFPALEWANDALAPVMPTAANAELIVHFFWTGLVWRAMLGGIFFP